MQAILVGVLVALAADPATGPQTEARFPSLVVPAGFKATLFACDPLVEYPSVIALGPRPGTVFVTYDYMTGLGTEIVRRDEIRLVADTDGDGYADQSTLFADGFNSLQGLAYHAGTVFAMHAPVLTALRDTDGDGKADERRDLLTGLGLPPEKNPTRLHCANGVVVGHDGWLYLAMGDNGTDVVRPEGDRLILNGGGILRCRPDGRDLHVFSTGLRNIYDIALDEELNVFVRDNENDGGDYMIRVCHSFFGADHGYPYLYAERPNEALAPLADLGRGSSAGIACYLETAFPPEYRGNLFCCEWGRSIVRYERKRQGSSFAPMREIEFATGAPNDPYGFKPTDIVVDYDGSLLVSDWCDGQRPKRGRGRIYRIAYVGEGAAVAAPVAHNDLASALKQLDSPSYHARVAAHEYLKSDDGRNAVRTALKQRELTALARMHAVWILASADVEDALSDVSGLSVDADARVSVSAVRALADLVDPAFSQRLPKNPSEDCADFVRDLSITDDPFVFREIMVALGRLHWSGAPEWLGARLIVAERKPLDLNEKMLRGRPGWRSIKSLPFKTIDPALMHAVQQTLRQSHNWPAVFKLLDEPEERPIRPLILQALADRSEEVIVDGLIERLKHDEPEYRRQFADLLTRIYKKPAPWTYWGYRPQPRPANTVAWERTDAIEQALDRILADPDHDVRLAILRRMQREQIPPRLPTLVKWLTVERSAASVTAILASLADFPPADTRSVLTAVIEGRDYAADNRRAALSQFLSGLSEADQGQLLQLAAGLEDGPVLIEVVSQLGQRPALDSQMLLLAKLDSPKPGVRAAALGACSRLSITKAAARVSEFLKDPDVAVRREAAAGAGALGVKDAASELVRLTGDADAAVRSASLQSLRQLNVGSAVAAAVAALDQAATQLAAIEYLGDFGTPEQAQAVIAAAATNRESEFLTAVVSALTQWEQRAPLGSSPRQAMLAGIADVQGQSGVVLRWNVAGPLSANAARELRTASTMYPADVRAVLGSGAEARVEVQTPQDTPSEALWLAFADVAVAAPTKAQFLSSSNSTLRVWLNGASVHERSKPAAFQADFDRFTAELAQGNNRVVVEMGVIPEGTQFQLRFRPLSSSAEHEHLTQFALQNTGNADRGRELFHNAEKTLCIKCHRLGDQGGQIGPNLTGVGRRFARIHLIESMLEPSRTIAPSYETVSVVLDGGRIVTGTKIAEDATTLSMGDETGKRHDLLKGEIEERITQRRSTMPEGLEKRVSDREFLDLLTFLAAEQKP
ncbi:MAG: HEAT repeat domain-containing protein [Planctomycetaceae bacterium]|nr:HEAT repeat domain-containing protein [Planctomycetaceae bacterium]